MDDMRFLFALYQAFDFLSSIMQHIIDVFNQYHWLFAFVIAPTVVSLIIFGINLSVSLVTKNTSGKGER